MSYLIFSNFITNVRMSQLPTNQKKVEPVIYKPRRGWLCCTKYKDRANFHNILQSLEISDIQKQIIQVRYLSILENFQRRSRNYSYVFFSGHFIVTVGSLFVPALLSIQNSDKSYTFSTTNFPVQVYWTTFVISLLVTIFNGILTLFKIDKKYYFLNTTLERLRSEGWQYFSLTGRYDGRLLAVDKPNHENQFTYFTHYVEKIKMKQVEEEYYKADEKIGQAPVAPGGQASSQQNNQEALFPPSIDQALNTMSNIPDPVKHALNSIIKSQVTLLTTPKKEENVTIIPESPPLTPVVVVDKESDLFKLDKK